MGTAEDKMFEFMVDRAAKRIIEINMINPGIVERIVREEFDYFYDMIPDARLQVMNRAKELLKEGWKP